MKNAATIETPASAGTGATPELIAHEWDVNGICVNAETVAIDLGKKADKRAAVARLGVDESGKWHVGYKWSTKGGRDCGDEPVRLDSFGYDARETALRTTVSKLIGAFTQSGDKVAVAALEAFFDRTWPAAADESLAPNKVDGARLPRGRFEEIPVAAVDRNPDQPRKEFDPVLLKELADAINEVGLLHPIGVRKLLPEELGELPAVGEVSPAERYEIIYGERRWRAHVQLKRETIEAKVYDGVTRAQGVAAALIENLQGADLNAIEEAEGYRDLMKAEGLTQEQCADRVGKSRPVVANALRILNLPEAVLGYLRAGKLTVAHAVQLVRFRPKDAVADKFPSWGKVVTAMAEETIAGQFSSSALEKDRVPFDYKLRDAGIGCYAHSNETGGEYPKEVKGHPAYINRGQGLGYFCFEPAHWQGLVKEFKAQEREREKRRREREEKKKARAVKSLEELPSGSYVEIRNHNQALLDLVPESTVDDVKSRWRSEKVTICTAPEFLKKVEKAIAALIDEDRKKKLPALIARARKKIAGLRKIGPREMVVLFAWVTDRSYGNRKAIYPARAKELGIKLPAKLEPMTDIAADGLSILAEVDAVDLFRTLLYSSFVGQWGDDPEKVENFDPRQEPAVLLKWFLELDDLGLLEETKSGQKELFEAVQAQDWYKTEFAKIETKEGAK